MNAALLYYAMPKPRFFYISFLYYSKVSVFSFIRNRQEERFYDDDPTMRS